MATIQVFLTVEAVAFLLAASIHRGLLVSGFQHQSASTAESVIVFVLFVALLLTWIRPGTMRITGLLGQAFAFLGTLMGPWQRTHQEPRPA